MNMFRSALLLLLVPFCLAAETLHVYSTTDIHGHIFSNRKNPNLLKLSEAIRNDIAGKGKENTLLIDCGDLIQGTFETQLDNGSLVLQLMNRTGYDVWVPGNHDFELGLQTLKDRKNDFKGTVLCANLLLHGKAPMASWKLFRRAGLNVAVIGITSEHISAWNWRPAEQGIAILKTMQVLSSVMPEVMKAKPDLIILGIHAGQFQSSRFQPEWQMRDIAARYPQIDLILGGHTHTVVKGLMLAGNVWYMQAGKHAAGYSKAEIVYDKQRKKRISLTTSYIALPPEAPEPQNPEPELKRKLAAIRKNMYSTVCRNAPALGADNPERTALTFCEAIADQTKAPIVFHGVLSRAKKYAGKYSRKDIYDLCPFENTVILMDLSPSECRTILREQLKAQKSKNPNAMPQFVKGVTLKPDGTLVLADGRIWNNEQERITTAFNSFIASSAGMRFPKLKRIAAEKEVNGRDTGLKIRLLLESYLRRNFS